MAQAQAQRGDSLTKKLRDYSVKYVKISEKDMSNSRTLVKDYIEEQIMVYCRQKSSLPILRLEYTGSVYERLKTEAADEVDVMVVLKTTKSEVMVEDPGVPGYVRLVARMDSNIRKYSSPEGYINPERLRNGWFYSLVDQAIRDFRARSPGSDIQLVLRSHGPAVQLDIHRKGTDSGTNLCAFHPQKMAQAQAQRGDSLTKKIRDYSVKYVKISEANMSYSRTLVKDYIEDQIMVYCRQKSSLAISRLEYTGSMYEKLKPQAADEVDVMVVLKTTKSEVMVEDPGVPGYVRLMARMDSNIPQVRKS
ncbi:hypothetical protein OS493_039018 [Desmophyllum pertusum]|uniref:Mab-21-like nucleotidyltransferase domain-containing protein n=1 Tax=Desmophyllum pertusum TaxID=174260 RepID=A0A9X0D5N0_9CNID|nr:hypothetical protein OS493_039018 [Desmophyllum pertusum]